MKSYGIPRQGTVLRFWVSYLTRLKGYIISHVQDKDINIKFQVSDGHKGARNM
jgi:hypothetical protein